MSIKYKGMPKDSTVVWKPKFYDADTFDFEKVKARLDKAVEDGNKEAVKTITRNIRRVCDDNPGIFDDFEALIS